ncbi:MAG: Papain family cysteine protease [Frankiales bacterium]|jgi:hypothetical protein|nr:Papain family cysteine protease [Frankiales bacterium]
MKLATRRRAALGAVATSLALVGGVIVAAPASAGTISRIDPGTVFNTNASQALTLTAQSTFLTGNVTLTRQGSAGDSITAAFTPTGPPLNKVTTDPINFSDGGTTFETDGPANPGIYDVTVEGDTPTSPSGAPKDSCTGCFTVASPSVPTLTGISLAGVAQNGAANDVTFSGSSFARGTVIEFLQNGVVDPTINANQPPVIGTTTTTNGVTTTSMLRRKVTVGASSVRGPRDVRVRNADGVTSAVCSACFTVNGAPLTSTTPTGGTNNPAPATPTVTITFRGTSLNSATGTATLALVYVGDAGSSTKNDLTITAQSNTTVFASDGSNASAEFDLRNAAPGVGAYQPTITRTDGSVNACTCRFDVLQATPPAVTGVSPKTQQAGSTQKVTVTGTNFSRGVRVSFGAGLTTTAVEFVNDKQVNATVAAASSAAAGARDVAATSTDAKTGTVCKACYTITSGASATPTATMSPSATPTATMTPSGSCRTASVRINGDRTINATGKASVSIINAAPNSRVELQGYSQNHAGDQNFNNDPTPVDRVGTADSSGTLTFNDIGPSSNTRFRARQVGCSYGDERAVLEVRATESLIVKRNGTRLYTFSGRSIPAREGGLIVSLYRITGTACKPGVNPSSCPGEKFVGQARAVALGQPGEGLYSITVRFPARDQNVRDEFVVKTGRDAQNAPGRSNVRSLLIY